MSCFYCTFYLTFDAEITGMSLFNQINEPRDASRSGFSVIEYMCITRQRPTLFRFSRLLSVM